MPETAGRVGPRRASSCRLRECRSATHARSQTGATAKKPSRGPPGRRVMTRRESILAAVTASVALAMPGLAADDKTSGDGGTAIRQHPGGLIQAEWLHRRPFKDETGRELGKIEEVWLDPKDGRVKEVVVSVGGFLGMGDRHRILPWQDVRIAWEKQDLVVHVSEPALRRARVHEASGDTQPAASPRTAPR